jgi:hypothetical protein
MQARQSERMASVQAFLNAQWTSESGWGNVMYIPAAPWCPRNERYAATVREAFLAGASPADFPAEDYERSWPDRFGPDQLNVIGRRGLGLN